MPAHNSEPLLVLLTSGDDLLARRAAALSPRVRTVTRQDLESRPELLGRLEVVYGPLSRDEQAAASGLRWLHMRGAGVDGLFPGPLERPEVCVTNSSGIHADSIAEHLFGMLLSWTRRLDRALDLQREERWASDQASGGIRGLCGSTLGVLGAGSIGAAVARAGAAFGMRVIGLRRSGRPLPGYLEMYSPDRRQEFFSRCHVVVNLLPLTHETRRFVGREELAAMPADAILLNAGRGGTVDTEALLEALNSDSIEAALLDVADPEPLPPGHPLWRHPRVRLTPHYSGAHPDYDERAGQLFLRNLRRYLDGTPLENQVNKSAGY